MPSSYVTVGSGDHHVLAIHGWFGSARGWSSFPEFIDGSAYTYAFMDLRGYGARMQTAGEFTVDEVAADALAVADDLGWDRFSVVGHSMGGKFAHRVLLAAPDRVRALVGLNPVPAGATPFDESGWALFYGAADHPGNRAAIIDFTTGNRLTKTFITGVVQHSLDNSAVPAGAVPFDEQGWALFSGASDHPENRAAIIDLTTGNKLTKTFINTLVRHSLETSTVPAFAAYLQAWARSDFSAQGKVDTATPVKLIVGVNDPALSADVMEQTWRVFFPDAELTILPDAGHYPMFESPVSLATSIEGFLGRE